MSHMFKSMPYYQETPYLFEMETLAFMPWIPQVFLMSNNYAPLLNKEGAIEEGGQGKTHPSVLEELKKTNAKMELLFENFGNRNIDFYILEKPLRREYIEPFITTII